MHFDDAEMINECFQDLDHESLPESPFRVLTERGRDIIDEPERQTCNRYSDGDEYIQGFPWLTGEDIPRQCLHSYVFDLIDLGKHASYTALSDNKEARVERVCRNYQGTKSILSS